MVGCRYRFSERAEHSARKKNVTTNPIYAKEVEALSGQNKSPTLDIDGTILPDASVEDVAKVLEGRGIVI